MPTAVPYHRNSDNESEASEGHSNPAEDDYAEFSRDGSPSLLELEADDFPTYFTEREGRLFHSSTSPYPLPADAPEQERLKGIHALANQLIGANYTSPVSNILAQDPNRQKNVLDLCTGTGTWVMEMAEDFPHILFTGIDIVPIATRYPLPNVNFEIGDITEELRWQNALFDFVHARGISLSVHDYRAILPEVIRVLRPGGIFLSCEWDLGVSFHPDSPHATETALHAPASTQFYQVLNAALESRGIRTVMSQITGYLHESSAFDDIQPNAFYVPVGTWHDNPRMQDLGRGFLATQSRLADSVKPFLKQVGHPQAYVDGLVREFVEELRTTDGLVGTYRLVHGIKSG
ncbi:S-adenosyl-L-methionine-dependent methyltransferase [Macrolepiota fuliginosa MF-IS2]|uniref:S-adenosyl-L-methionine-dependent methyltransferase n=1 Tax=Macrolepiota fuliginosa MF-IS2 TaxID=1400762 RepID=A0A9P6C015_9AGAR|nr:S-adenosyl-L-methionine-dependent methyltransferase [Macrolepiota fuliginosa MF-IS2]